MTVSSRSRDQPVEARLLSECPPELVDGWMVHAAAIERGLSTWLLSGQALLVGSGGGSEGSLAFAHGVPRETQLSTATLVQDKRIRRAVLEDHKIPVPRGATFTIGRGLRGARRYASRIGYPVVIKPMVGDNTIETQSHVSSPAKFKRAVQHLETAPPFRPNHTASSYAFTAIQTPRDDGSRETRDNYRYLVEKQMSGHYLRTVIVHQELVSAVYSPQGAWGTARGGKDVSEILHPSFNALADRVGAAFPGLSVLAVDFVASKSLSRPVDQQRVWVVEVSERPWLHLQARYAPETIGDLGDAILRGSAQHNNVTIPRDGQTQVACSIRWEGVPHPTEFLRAVKAAADRMNLTGWGQMEDLVGGVAVGHLQGESSAIALLSEYSMAGRLECEATMSVDSAPAPSGSYSTFDIRPAT